MFGCYNCSVLRDDKLREEIKKDVERKAEELKQLASQIGLQAQVNITSK